MRKFFLLLLPLLVLVSGCNKEPGEGGLGVITGRVMAQNYNTLNPPMPVYDPYPFAEHRVYIIYGDGTYHDDDVRTGPDGRFRFTGLRKGTYKLYTISQTPRVAPTFTGTEAVWATVEIVEKKEEVDVGDIRVDRYRGWQ